MISVQKSALILACLTTLTCAHCADTLNGAKSIGVCSAFGIILPAAFGVGSYYAEEHLGLNGPVGWREEKHLKIEATKLIQTFALTAVSSIAWSITKGFVANDMRAALVMMSIYAYSQGRALYSARESRLLKAASYCLPTAITMLAYTRIPELSPHLDFAVKPTLVFGLAHMCGA